MMRTNTSARPLCVDGIEEMSSCLGVNWIIGWPRKPLHPDKGTLHSSDGKKTRSILRRFSKFVRLDCSPPSIEQIIEQTPSKTIYRKPFIVFFGWYRGCCAMETSTSHDADSSPALHVNRMYEDNASCICVSVLFIAQAQCMAEQLDKAMHFRESPMKMRNYRKCLLYSLMYSANHCIDRQSSDLFRKVGLFKPILETHSPPFVLVVNHGSRMLPHAVVRDEELKRLALAKTHVWGV